MMKMDIKPIRGDVPEDLVELSNEIWRVLACPITPMRMLMIGIIGGLKSRGSGLPGKWVLK